MGAQTAVARGFQYGLIIFTLTAVLGLASATQIFGALDRNTLLTHLHSGTLGWITMGVLSTAAWMFGASSPSLGRNLALSAGATALYVLGFWSGSLPARALTGSIELVVILAWWWWVLQRSLAQGLGVIGVGKLSVLLGLTTLIIGSTIGVIVQLQFATATASAQTGALIGTHASAQVGGYLVLVAAGIVEWLLRGDQQRSLAGTLQPSFLFVAGLLFAMGTLVGITPFLLLANLLQTIAIGMIVVRIGPAAARVAWGAVDGKRHAAVVVGYLVLAVGLIVALTQIVIANQGDFSKVPLGMIHGLDHAMFVGVSTNALFATIIAFTASRPRVWPWADQVIFWGLNLGALSFIGVLLFVGSGYGAKPFTSPVAFTASIMGLSALLGIATFWQRLQPAPEAARVPAPA